ncbi:MAG: hypothetical protein GC181_08820 [Bacteroidetes bacterium]|nr:hypothetical protein [Bacteroidota bacterium]
MKRMKGMKKIESVVGMLPTGNWWEFGGRSAYAIAGAKASADEGLTIEAVTKDGQTDGGGQIKKRLTEALFVGYNAP